MIDFTNEQLRHAISEAWNITEVAEKLGYVCGPKGPSTATRARLLTRAQELNISTERLKKSARPQYKYSRVNKTCPVCSTVFETLVGHRDEKETCSHACSNTFYRSGQDNPNWQEQGGGYRKLALASMPHVCNRCTWAVEPKVLQVHHKDRDRANNDLGNLEILCPNCHAIEHWIS